MSPARRHSNLSMDTSLSQPIDHNHTPNPERIAAIELNNQAKARAVTSDEPTNAILHSTLRTFPLNAAIEPLRTEMIMQTILKARQTPAATSTNGLLDDLRKTDCGEDFLLRREEDMIIFNDQCCEAKAICDEQNETKCVHRSDTATK